MGGPRKRGRSFYIMNNIDNIEFWKMNGSGNDFILIDNRDGKVAGGDMNTLVKGVCRRMESVGADGVIFIIKSEKYDFAWRFFNADGSEAEMCGNGSRCAARFASLTGIAGTSMIFETLAGPISAEVTGRIVKVLMPIPSGLRKDVELPLKSGLLKADFINTGVPHAVIQVKDLENHPVFEEGREIRYHSVFSPAGTNANFVRVVNPGYIEVRTYERGVEDETLACGTGSIAAALICNARGLVSSPVMVKTSGGEELKIYFEKDNGSFTKVWLEGGTAIACKGRLDEEAI
jgi:diaminopimelate epimerase